MTVFLLVMAALVVVILLTRLSPPARWVERRSVRDYEQSMQTLRSLPNRRIAEHPADQVVPAPPPLASPPPRQPGPVEAGGDGSTQAEAGEEAKPALVFVADDPGVGPFVAADASVDPFLADDAAVDPMGPSPTLPNPPSIENWAPTRDRRAALLAAPSSLLGRARIRVAAGLAAFGSAVSPTVGRPRVRLAAGVTTVVVGAIVAGTLLSLTSSSPGRGERVRQVRSAPVAEAPPASSTIPPTPSSVEETPTTTAFPAQTAAQPIEPTTTTSIPTTSPSPEMVTPPPEVVPSEPPPSPSPPVIVPPTPPSTGPPATTGTDPSTTTTRPNNTGASSG